MAMAAGRTVPRVLLATTIAITCSSFLPCTQAQQCSTAHDPQALKALQQRAAAGDADSQCGLGKQYEFALGVPEDEKQAAFWLQNSAEQGDIVAQVELGVVFDKIQDYAQALIWYRRAAERWHARAEYNLALAYQNGEAVPKDLEQAIDWYRKASDQGDVLALMNLGAMYENGVGVSADYLKAADLYRKAAEEGFAEGEYGLGFLYLTGKGMPNDEVQAATWMRKAA
jgi:TPR repeat protein